MVSKEYLFHIAIKKGLEFPNDLEIIPIKNINECLDIIFKTTF